MADQSVDSLNERVRAVLLNAHVGTITTHPRLPGAVEDAVNLVREHLLHGSTPGQDDSPRSSLPTLEEHLSGQTRLPSIEEWAARLDKGTRP
jgi:hypothetical protein